MIDFLSTLLNSGHQLSDEQIEACRELERRSALDIDAMTTGHREDAVLMQAALEGWDYQQFLQVTKYRGKHYQMMLSLADKWLEVQGIAALHFGAKLALWRNNALGKQKVISMLERNRTQERHYIEKYADDPEMVARILEVIGLSNTYILQEYHNLLDAGLSIRRLLSD